MDFLLNIATFFLMTEPLPRMSVGFTALVSPVHHFTVLGIFLKPLRYIFKNPTGYFMAFNSGLYTKNQLTTRSAGLVVKTWTP
jgi:hypothetical protein